MIKIENNQVFSSEGKMIHRVGSDVYFKRGSVLLTDTTADYEEVDEVPAYTKAEYDAMVAKLVRERYTADEEFALQRKALNAMLYPEAVTLDESGDTAQLPAEIRKFNEYNAYVEQCKAEAPIAIMAARKLLRMAED